MTPDSSVWLSQTLYTIVDSEIAGGLQIIVLPFNLTGYIREWLQVYSLYKLLVI